MNWMDLNWMEWNECLYMGWCSINVCEWYKMV